MMLLIPCLFLAAALNSELIKCDEDAFYFTHNPNNTVVIERQTALLSCKTSDASAVYYWTHNEQPIKNSTRKFQRGSNLYIRQANRDVDPGVYECIATLPSGFSIRSSPANLQVHWISEAAEVTLESPASEDKITAGRELVLKCAAEGSPDVKVEWFRNGELFDRVSVKGKKLLLKSPTPRDNGVYRCSVSNPAGRVHSSKSFILALPGPEWAKIKIPPQDTYIRKDAPASLDCLYDMADVTEWYFKETGPLKNSSELTIYPNNTLLIHKMSSKNEGLYGCVGIREESLEVPQKYTAQLEIAFLYNMNQSTLNLESDEPVIIPEGESFQITCSPPFGLPKPTVMWQDVNGKSLQSSASITITNQTLFIKKAQVNQHTGTYVCSAENIADKKQTSFKLIVAKPPSIQLNPSPAAVDEGSTALFICGHTATPPPVTTVYWLHNSAPISSDIPRFNISDNGSLTIHNVHVSDKGEYVCVINSTVYPLVKSKPAHLYVQERLKFNPKPSKKIMELGQGSKIQCRAQGYDTPVVKWFKVGKSNVPVKAENGTLVFKNVTLDDQGQYMCVASNSQGRINVTIDVDVVVSPKFLAIAKNPTQALEGYSITIDCVADGYPKPTIQWDKNTITQEHFDRSRFLILENGSLLITEVHLNDEGKYGCTAGNSGGFNRSEVFLNVISEGYHPGPDGWMDSGDDFMLTRTVIVTLSAAGSYMFLVIGLTAWCRLRRRRRKMALNAGVEPVHSLLGKNDGLELRDKHRNGEIISGRSDGENTTQSQGSGQSRRSRNGCGRTDFLRKDLHNMMLLGNGQFGEVYLAQAHGLIDEQGDTVVMVKALKNTREEIALQEFTRELDLFSRLNHENIVKLYGLCRDAEPHYMLLEYTDWGDLKQFLLATRKDHPTAGKPRPPPLSVPQILSMAHQVALGMEHLTNHRLLHKDLAARNCLIVSNLSVKISLSSLSVDTYSSEYFKFHNQLIPLRWMPPEAVFESDYSMKSDTYSYACLVWEMFTKGDVPFSRLSDEEVLKNLESGELKWKHHKSMPSNLVILLHKCWSRSPKDRPTFSQIALEVNDILSAVNNPDHISSVGNYSNHV
ncbi:unnamed protein product [Bemisia tabaci]|uniref:Inactive tyrosine-protein kinase 7 n=1 Tax=Bemisia tabaci TaxID=7038 RepID=A0A9P0F5C0_BEMTA|nr:unnamed protein product [Bemisia tabaci]